MIWFLLAALLLCADLGIKYRINRHGASAVFPKGKSDTDASPKSSGNTQTKKSADKDQTIIPNKISDTASNCFGHFLNNPSIAPGL